MMSGYVLSTPLGPLSLHWNAVGFSRIFFDDALSISPESLPLDNDDQALWLQKLQNFLTGQGPWPKLPYSLPQATSLQHQVWRALTTIPAGQTRTYGEVAAMIGYGHAVRAVAQACAANPCAVVVPCHRVVPRAGGVGGYRWGEHRKKGLLALESVVF